MHAPGRAAGVDDVTSLRTGLVQMKQRRYDRNMREIKGT